VLTDKAAELEELAQQGNLTVAPGIATQIEVDFGRLETILDNPEMVPTE